MNGAPQTSATVSTTPAASRASRHCLRESGCWLISGLPWLRTRDFSTICLTAPSCTSLRPSIPLMRLNIWARCSSRVLATASSSIIAGASAPDPMGAGAFGPPPGALAEALTGGGALAGDDALGCGPVPFVPARPPFAADAPAAGSGSYEGTSFDEQAGIIALPSNVESPTAKARARRGEVRGTEGMSRRLLLLAANDHHGAGEVGFPIRFGRRGRVIANAWGPRNDCGAQARTRRHRSCMEKPARRLREDPSPGSAGLCPDASHALCLARPERGVEIERRC